MNDLKFAFRQLIKNPGEMAVPLRWAPPVADCQAALDRRPAGGFEGFLSRHLDLDLHAQLDHPVCRDAIK
jgi:hypothetical protein